MKGQDEHQQNGLKARNSNLRNDLHQRLRIGPGQMQGVIETFRNVSNKQLDMCATGED